MEIKSFFWAWGSGKWAETRFVSMVIMFYVALFLLISPLFPGVSWFQLGDFTLPVVNYYHVVMIPFALLMVILALQLFDAPLRIRKLVNLSVYPVIIFSILGLFLFYPSWGTTADEAFQAIRDIIVFLDALLTIVALLIFPFRNSGKFRKIWGAYFLVLIAGISAEMAATFGMLLEYGSLFGFNSVGFFNNYVNSLGGLQTFLGNLLTSHSHQMLPAIMGMIVGASALIFGYEKFPSTLRNVINIGTVVAIFGTLSMTYLYWISSFGTYVIPAVFVSGAGGMNGLALDDTQTGIVGIGAMIVLAGIYLGIRKEKGSKLLSYATLGSWLGAMFGMVGVGYIIELNEVYYGFGTSGVPPDGGPGYLYDMAFTNGHLLFVFFLLTLIAGIFIALKWFDGDSRFKPYIGGLAIAGIVIGSEGLLVYTMLLSWILEAIGLWLLTISVVLVPVSMYEYNIHASKAEAGREQSA